MNTTQIDYFIELYHTLNYSKAADNLGISQPTLSKAIKHLESDAGFRLFQKDGRKIIPTAQAKYFYPLAKQSMTLLNQAIEEAHQQRNIISIGCISSVQMEFLPHLVEMYSKDHNVQFKISIDSSSKIIEALENHQIDLAICTAPESGKNISSFPIIQQQLMVCLNQSHRLSHKSEISLQMLKNERLIAHNESSAMRKIVKSIYDAYDIHPIIAAEAQEDNSIIALVRKNLGIGIVTMSKSLITDGVVFIPLQQNVVERNVSICYRKNDPLIEPLVCWIRKNKQFHIE